MGINFIVSAGSGRAKCKICAEKIEKEETQVHGHAYQTAGSCHLTCLNKWAEKEGLKWQLE